MIQAVDEELDGILSGCRVHDIVLDMLRKFSFEENFIAILEHNVEAIYPPSNVRRLALHKRYAEYYRSEGNKVVQMPKVRSYTAFGCSIDNKWVYFPSYKLLRVLDLIECRFMQGCQFEHLGDLLRLRYLGINCGGSIPVLSKQLTNLKLLQTLVLYGTLPVSIVLPTQLLCLHATSVPDGIGKLTSLKQLRIRGAPKMFVKELSNLRELWVLSITNRGDMDKSMQIDFVVTLSNLQNIQQIDMIGFRLVADTAMWEAAGFMLPRCLRHLNLWISFSKVPLCINPSRLPNLCYLRLWVVDTMDEQDLRNLAMLPALGFLCLEIKSTVAAVNINADGYGFFQKLRYFEINSMVQFQQHKEDSSISLHIWNGEGATTFGSRKSIYSKNVPSAVMPNLEVLSFDIPLQALNDNNDDCSNIGLEYLPCISEVKVHIDCYGVSAEEGHAALAALGNTCKVHPDHPTLDTYKFNEELMVSSQDEEADMASQAVNNIDLGKLSP